MTGSSRCATIVAPVGRAERGYLGEFCEEHYKLTRPFYNAYKRAGEQALQLYQQLLNDDRSEQYLHILRRCYGKLTQTIEQRIAFTSTFVHETCIHQGHEEFINLLNCAREQSERWLRDRYVQSRMRDRESLSKFTTLRIQEQTHKTLPEESELQQVDTTATTAIDHTNTPVPCWTAHQFTPLSNRKQKQLLNRQVQDYLTQCIEEVKQENREIVETTETLEADMRNVCRALVCKYMLPHVEAEIAREFPADMPTDPNPFSLITYTDTYFKNVTQYQFPPNLLVRELVRYLLRTIHAPTSDNSTTTTDQYSQVSTAFPILLRELLAACECVFLHLQHEMQSADANSYMTQMLSHRNGRSASHFSTQMRRMVRRAVPRTDWRKLHKLKYRPTTKRLQQQVTVATAGMSDNQAFEQRCDLYVDSFIPLVKQLLRTSQLTLQDVQWFMRHLQDVSIHEQLWQQHQRKSKVYLNPFVKEALQWVYGRCAEVNGYYMKWMCALRLEQFKDRPELEWLMLEHWLPLFPVVKSQVSKLMALTPEERSVYSFLVFSILTDEDYMCFLYDVCMFEDWLSVIIARCLAEKEH